VDVDEQVANLQQLEPLVVIVGTPGINAQYLIYNEGDSLAKLSTLRRSVAFLFACYYIFDIRYPRSNAIFLFFQSIVFNIDKLDNPPTNLARLIHCMPE
jgi:hypothetical protein